MVLIDRKTEPQNCPLCKSTYDEKETRPEALIPCGHTFCAKCVVNFEKACKMCAEKYNQIIPDYDMIDLVKEAKKKLVIDEPDEGGDGYKPDINGKMIKPEVYHLIMSGTKPQQLMGTEVVRKLLSSTHSPPIQEVIDLGLVSKFIEFLDSTQFPQLQYQAAWALTNVASGSSDQTSAVINAGGIPKLLKLMKDAPEDIQDQAIWTLGNIAGDSPLTRDLVLEAGILEPLMNILKDNTKNVKTLNNAIWCLSNLCRGKPQVRLEYIQPAIPFMCELLVKSETQEGMVDLCWALSYLTDGSNDRIQAVLDHIDLVKLLNLLDKEELSTPVLRIFGNIATGDDNQTQAVVDVGVINRVGEFIDHAKVSIRTEVCWFLSNITAGTKDQIQAVIDSELIPKLIALYRTESNFKLKNEITWVLANVTSSGSTDHIRYIVENGALELFLQQIQVSEKSKAKVALEALENVYKLANLDDDSDYSDDQTGLEEAEGQEKQDRKDHPDDFFASKVHQFNIKEVIGEARERLK